MKSAKNMRKNMTTQKCNFVAFILTHGRPNRVLTYDTLRNSGYTGPIYLVCDDEDKMLPEYRRRFDNILVFSKSQIADTFDSGDNISRRGVVYARNACFDLAKQVGATHFIELDDDYTGFYFRFDSQLRWRCQRILNLDVIFNSMLKFFENTSILTIALAQGGDYIGGIEAATLKNGIPLLRKAMNSFICSVDRRFDFVGRINEDTNAYTLHGMRGGVFFTLMHVALVQLQTQVNASGMTDLYLDFGTYVKSFYTVMYCPSAARISVVGNKHQRIHHRVNWRYAVPKILSEKLKKQ